MPKISKKDEAKAYGKKLRKDLKFLLKQGEETLKTSGKALGVKWNSQIGTRGAHPCVAVYRDGELKPNRCRYLGDKALLPATAIDDLPTKLKWQGSRSNFRVLGQIVKGKFEALAIVMLDDSTLITNLTEVSTFTAALHNGFVTPVTRKRDTKPMKTVLLVSTYTNRVVFEWVSKDTGTRQFRVKLNRI